MNELKELRYFVYFGCREDGTTTTKIGQTKNLYGRVCNYNTAVPFNDFVVFILIQVFEKAHLDELESLFLNHFHATKAKHSAEYKHRKADNEWITIRPTHTEVQRILKQRDVDFRYDFLTTTEISEELRVIHAKQVSPPLDALPPNPTDRAVKVPLPYHLQILVRMANNFRENDKGYMILPCGIGKSFLSIYHAMEMSYKTIVIGTPTLYLQSQLHDEVLEVAPNAIILHIGGDKSTDIDQIKKKVLEPREVPLFVITTYASCSKLVRPDLNFDIKTGDECHHLTGRDSEGYRQFHNIRSEKSLFMTATKKVTDTDNDNTLFGMEDDTKFGNCIDEKSVKWAIEQRVIVDYRVVVLKASCDTIEGIVGDLNIVHDKELFVSAYMTLKSMDTYEGLSHVLCYTNTTANAEKLQHYIGILLDKGIFSSLNREGFYNRALHSESKCNMRDEVDTMKNSRYGIISCVYIFGEGFNLPKLNGVCFAENMVSVVRIIQCALRSARIERGNDDKLSYLLVPFIDKDDFNEENVSLEKVRTIINKLGNVDDSIEDRLTVSSLIRADVNGTNVTIAGPDYELKDDDLGLRRLRLRLRKRGDLKSKLSMEEEEYRFYKALLKEHNVKSCSQYDEFDHKDKRTDIERYFKKKVVWPGTGWYDLLSIDTSMYPQTKKEWIQACHAENITSMEEYKRRSQEPGSTFPEEPDKLYHKEWTSSIMDELGISRPRRC